MYKKKLLEMGIPANIKGFEYLNMGIADYVPAQTKMTELYSKIANKYNTGTEAVKRCIRHAISLTAENLPNGQFIAKYKMLWGNN